MRCEDVWYNRVLNVCREGRLVMNTDSFLHGYPTSTPGSWDPVQRRTPCTCAADMHLVPGSQDEHYKQSWAELFLRG